MFLIGLSLSFHYVLDAYVFTIPFSKLSLMPGKILAFNLPEKYIISPLVNCMFYILSYSDKKLLIFSILTICRKH